MLIHQLFYNLILNSLKFAKAGVPSRISISASAIVYKDIDYMQLRVADNGIGIKPEYTDSIFTSFTRLNSADLYEGSDLGLALCKKIVERHNGEITAKGELGEGAVFTILFPYNKS
ncbi:hypothetical protein FUA48_09900 [Flavobacterium alkalisoli]|uniref:histidine kinase n=1 Tax=Flavobacterium alkalisoli TaxID=2602769 RepID=A0A5B9FRC0_9FLAO|nr:ATP-binding protein [Flavobacterium alkalisoli]QEE49883.1 hypothetical protein FUA48_09900 [Flavobacterium alkalisoli]